ncbi:glycerol-3-phosphate dehydrogenase/oxidase [Rubeoparvulum massiliense]|uniref:glycerol-3-phosphate dehydrogenase/oxidase n=1 Tax=Rubeoparvulum massiliense TaxID=1631346 RepID=UPI00065E260A|nr:glycerol-3-phosphate dehydrogenase/oxidase [Rubeoparvulum massiliense]
MSSGMSARQRVHMLQAMEKEAYDLLIIGGGITGAGIALDAQTRGLKTALLEMQDFASGTSSRSTKLVHGGLRYLKQGKVKMVAEVGRERTIVYENGPHVTQPEWMLLPFYEGGTFGPLSTSLGLWLYDRLAGVKGVERRRMLNVEETLELVPSLKKEGLRGSGLYVEYRTDDARLTIEVLKSAVVYGAEMVNYTKVVQLRYEENRVVGVVAEDQLTGEQYEINAKKIVNATGPWVDYLREMDGSKQGKTLHVTKGVHLVFDQGKFPLSHAVYFDTPDGRMVFAIPRDGKTYVGTTDTNYDGDYARPQMSEADLNYLLRAVDYIFPELKIKPKDMESGWAGLRPLIHEEGRDPSEISRKDEIFISPSGLISIAGGKLTGYRKMAENVVNQVVAQLQQIGFGEIGPCRTKELPISGGEVGGSHGYSQFILQKCREGMDLGLTKEEAEYWINQYGSNIDRLFQIYRHFTAEQQASSLDGEISIPLNILVPLQYGMEYEMVVKPSDFLIRRSGALLFNIEMVQQWKEQIIDYMAAYLHWSKEVQQNYRDELMTELEAVVSAVPTS